MKLIHTKDYLLLIDEEADININNYIVAKDLSGIAKIKEYKKGHILANDISQNIELGISYHQTSDWNKIIAYRPLTEGAKELDLPLLPPFKEDEFLKYYQIVFDYVNSGIRNFKAMMGLLKLREIAQSKQFSLEDIEQVIKLTLEDAKKSVIWSEEYYKHLSNRVIQSLSTQQLPKEFTPEYKDEYISNGKIVKSLPISSLRELKTITNSEGKQELVGTYKY